MSDSTVISCQQLPATVQRIVAAQPIVDLHTHLYPVSFGTPVANGAVKTDAAGLMLWGLDELLTYHYLVAEVYRVVPASVLPYEQFWKMSKSAQADHIWRHLFVERTPLSEACRGVITTLTKLGLDPNVKNLDSLRRYFAEQDPDAYIDKVMQAANVSSITMTNAVFDDNERQRWLDNPQVGSDPRFQAVLRIDPMLLDWQVTSAKLDKWGYDVLGNHADKTVAEAQRFLNEWIDRQKAIYLALSLPPTYRYPADPKKPVDHIGQQVLEKIILPVCAQRGLPFAMMIGCKRQANPGLADAGDAMGESDVQAVVNLCRQFPHNRFLVTMLARENQHELCVAARKFGNLMLFGCWWFLNNPSLIEEMTRMRLELLGTSFIPQHSDARILDQLIYKWTHSRQIIGRVLTEKYQDLQTAGWALSEDDIKRDVRGFFQDNFRDFLNMPQTPAPKPQTPNPNPSQL